MPTVYRIAWEPPAITGRYQKLQRRDYAVWERWLAAHGEEFDAVAYDVAVGGSEPALPDLTDAERLGWKYTTALKIDVMLRDENGVWIVEVKPIGSVSAIGACIAYPRLIERDEPDLLVAGAGIVCGDLPADIEWLAAALNLRTWVV